MKPLSLKSNLLRSAFPAALALILAAGCASKFSADNFNRVKSGMKPGEVSEILGPPNSQKSSEVLGIRTMTWTYKKGKKNAELIFVGDILIEKSGNF